MAQIITKRSKVYVLYLYVQIEYKSITVYIKNKIGGCAYIIVLQGTVHLEYISKKQRKTKQCK